jgi:hypothetical protein
VEFRYGIKSKDRLLGMIAYACNPSYIGDGNPEDCGWGPAHVKN